MPVRIRLRRGGKRKFPFYRIVVTPARTKRDGKYIEAIGTYNPIPSKHGEKEIRLNHNRIKYWLSVGAEPSDRVATLFSYANLMPKPPRAPSTRQHVPRKVLKEQAAEAARSFSSFARPARAPGSPLSATEAQAEQELVDWALVNSPYGFAQRMAQGGRA